MPGAVSTITMHVDGAAIHAASDGGLLDADGDGTPGGELTWSFSTVNLAGVPGTSVFGTSRRSGRDLKPGTIDDVAGVLIGVLITADDVYLSPLEHVKVFILGREDQVVFTDAAGHFELHDIPAGDVKLAIDGRTATNAPAGVFFPEMVMDLILRPGGSQHGHGRDGDRRAGRARDRGRCYLPRLQTSILHAVSATQPTTITVDAASAPDLTAERRQFLTLEVQPQLDPQQRAPLANVQIGISTVHPTSFATCCRRASAAHLRHHHPGAGRHDLLHARPDHVPEPSARHLVPSSTSCRSTTPRAGS